MLQLDPEHLNTQTVGRLGELVVEMELLARGWLTGNFNSSVANAAAWDLFAAKKARSVKLRVKSKRPGVDALQWSAKADGSVFLQLDPADAYDFVAAVDFHAAGDWDVYLVPTAVVAEALASNHRAWLSTPKRDGAPKKDGSRRVLWLNERSPDQPGQGYRRVWAQFRNAWDLLEG
jgi:hypothetical protein